VTLELENIHVQLQRTPCTLFNKIDSKKQVLVHVMLILKNLRALVYMGVLFFQAKRIKYFFEGLYLGYVPFSPVITIIFSISSSFVLHF
jgi:hypothetical protein